MKISENEALSRRSEQPNWVAAMDLQDADFPTSYAASMHWSLTQFTPATNNIAPVSGLERWDSCPASHAFLYDVILYINLVYTWYLYVIIYLYIYIFKNMCLMKSYIDDMMHDTCLV